MAKPSFSASSRPFSACSFDTEHLGVVLPHERRRRHHVELRPLETMVENVVHVSRKYRFDLVLRHERHQPRACGIIDVVVGARLVGTEQEQRVMHEDEDALLPRARERLFEPGVLRAFLRQPAVQDRIVDEHEAHAALIERPPARPEIRFVDRDPALANAFRRHHAIGLVADIVIARQDVHDVVVLAEHLMRQRHRFRKRRKFGNRVHEIAEVDDELRIVARDLACNEAGATGRLLVDLPRRRLVAGRRLDVRIADDGKREEAVLGSQHGRRLHSRSFGAASAIARVL